MILIHTFWYLYITAEVFQDWYIITKVKHTPNHSANWWRRFAVAVLYWLLCPVLIDHNIELDQWWAIPIWELFSMWFLFNTALNISRKLHPWNLGETGGSRIDRWLYDHVGEFPSWFFLALLFGASCLLTVVGLNAVVGR
jgi:hypothetical protein